MKETDLRVIKTKKALFKALMSLLQEYSFEEIKVSDICSKALINRSTFYAHYNDKYELFIDGIEVLKRDLKSALDSNITNTKEYYLKMLDVFLDSIDKEKNTYTSIMINNRNSIIFDMIYDVLNKDIKEKLQEEKKDNSIPFDIVTSFYIGAVVNVGLLYLKNPKYSKEELLNYLEKLIPNDLKSFK